jgi:D-glycero-D-manno-heptose 1,7-bisphosphate phosphatase
MTKLLLLDKDGTLTAPKSGGAFPQHPKDQRLREGVEQALKEYAENDWTMAIVSNQGGVAAGHKTLEDAIAEMRYAMQLIYPLLKYPQNLHFRGLLCPDQGDTLWAINAFSQQGEWRSYNASESLCPGKYKYRKPAPGMLLEALDYLKFSGINIGDRPEDRILMVGDRPEDQQAAFAAGVPFLWEHEWVAQ